MLVEHVDFAGADQVFARRAAEWAEVHDALTAMHLHLKASDQKGRKGKLIFDPVGTNEAIKQALTPLGWASGVPLPREMSEFGLHVDFGRSGVIVEAQFSNYPFLLNNLLRCEMLFRDRRSVSGGPAEAAIIVTKAGALPAQNSSLYFEQARAQLTALAKHGVFTVPVRLVGLGASVGEEIEALSTTYASARYSRSVAAQILVKFIVSPRRRRRPDEPAPDDPDDGGDAES